MDYIEQHFINLTKEEELIAIAMDKGIAGIQEIASDVYDSLGDGLNRSMRRAVSYAVDVDEYNSIHSQDERLISAIRKFSFEYNPIKDIVNTYIELALIEKTESEAKNIYEKIIQKLGYSANLATKRLTKMVIIEAIVESLYQIILFSPVVRKNIKMVSNVAFTAIGGYGRFEQAAIAAETLSWHDPFFYWKLYGKGIEMLYFIPKPKIEKGLYLVSGKYPDEDIANTIVNLIVG
ncbi:hypothetical protein OKT22_01405 [Providencia rettgeri]|uniref:hypothetical protein n=1 Tax=Providencia rettgeri TaxID=587 RepID=UPI00226EA221|nr:hypothetical protein [Providencia rettgeri]MCX9107692.1 hypothetical protein [Providencia rettgeri]HEM6859186.1 hypothetical protein [Providencia rettgeri]HEM7131953.1 hypothetical protein [Providencia rettgeri]